MRFIHWISEAWGWLLDLGAQVSGVQYPGVGLVIIAVALLLGIVRLYRWVRAELAKSESILSRLATATRHKLIPLMFGTMAVAGVLLIMAAALGAMAYSHAPASENPAQQTAPAPVPQKLTKNYFPAEKIQLGNLLSGIADKLNNEGLPAAARGWNIGGSGADDKASLIVLRENVQNTMLQVEVMRRGIWDDIIAKNPRYADELNAIVDRVPSRGNPIVDYHNQLESLAREVDIFLREYDGLNQETRRWLASDLLGQFSERVHVGSDDFKGWIQFCNMRIDGMREALR